MGSPALERGSRVRVRLGDMDLIALDIHAQFIESLQQTQEPNNTDEDEEVAAGPLAIAVDLDDAELAPAAPSDASS
jgi:exoribonuclease-2